jgi:hypothetical protein
MHEEGSIATILPLITLQTSLSSEACTARILTRTELSTTVYCVLCTSSASISMEWALSRRVDAASKGQLGN